MAGGLRTTFVPARPGIEKSTSIRWLRYRMLHPASTLTQIQAINSLRIVLVSDLHHIGPVGNRVLIASCDRTPDIGSTVGSLIDHKRITRYRPFALIRPIRDAVRGLFKHQVMRANVGSEPGRFRKLATQIDKDRCRQ